jgi:hypothetical protein
MTTTRSTIATMLAAETRRLEAGEAEARKTDGPNLSPETGLGTESACIKLLCISRWAVESLAENLDKGILSKGSICI